ncbi:hypothetical protein ATL39_1779 [Sinobaca qinghaiensis]|uniref:Uncharacterized protein n=1 Tax=Sinobaca qinghaiensis TaxID=342944 RepID=A0A419V4S1_9BACL|nr:hypothetical protein ATL39_1779 [Sinobaca qinghaiensis]
MLRLLLFPLLSLILLLFLTGLYLLLEPYEHAFFTFFTRDVLLLLTGGALVLFLFSMLPAFTTLYRKRSNIKSQRKK